MTGDEAWDRLFDELYLRTYALVGRDADPEAEALAAGRLVALEPGADVLDCPCGYGRHAIPLGRAGFHVVGADRSPVLLEEARRRGGDEEWPRWVEADHRELPFADASFDAVLNLFTSLGYRGEGATERRSRSSVASCGPAASWSSRRCTGIASRASSSGAAGTRCRTEASSSRSETSTRSPARSRPVTR